MTSSRAKEAVRAAITEGWVLLFAAAGRAAARSIRRWQSSGGQRVLVVAPHPDDEVCGCGGTVLLHRLAGDDVRVLYVTDGRRSRASGLGPDEMARRRRQEAHSAAAQLDVKVEWLGLPEGEWDERVLRERLTEYLRLVRPHVIYAPSLVDFHAEHVRVAEALALVLRRSGEPSAAAIRIYQVQVPLTPVLTNLIAPLAAVRATAVAALRTYQTQLGSVLRTLRMKRYAASFYGVPALAEEFWELTAADYSDLHRAPVGGGRRSVFRGLRSFPLSDPLAYCKGFRERHSLSGRAVGDM